jgi:hypothetical protein
MRDQLSLLNSSGTPECYADNNINVYIYVYI